MAKSVLVFEWMVGGGLLGDSHGCQPASKAIESDPTRLMSEGAGMLRAVLEDFVDCGIEPIVPVDRRFESPASLKGQKVLMDNEKQLLSELISLARQVDWIILIAPESLNRLSWVASYLEPFADKFLCPDRLFVELATDKTRTIERIRLGGQKTPMGSQLDHWLETSTLKEFPKPAVLKPNTGAGSEGVQRLNHLASCSHALLAPEQWRIEEWVPGDPASISVLCSIDAEQNHFFSPTRQIFSDCHWVDCQVICESEKVRRATQLARNVLKALPETNGYVGIDFVFGNSEDDDTVIEVNPRLTSSYLRLRNSVEFNIAERMTRLCDKRAHAN